MTETILLTSSVSVNDNTLCWTLGSAFCVGFSDSFPLEFQDLYSYLNEMKGAFRMYHQNNQISLFNAENALGRTVYNTMSQFQVCRCFEHSECVTCQCAKCQL